MTPSNQELLAKIEAFSFDEPGTAFTFAQRLARENGWEAAFTRRVIEEYRRFVFLAMTAGHMVCPSEAVDQVWHQHLTFTQNYWEDFCEKVLGKPLHHGPTRGGSSEAVKHYDMYAQTLASYREIMGAEPPADIWEPAVKRFGEGGNYVRINRRRAWVIPKPRWLQLAALWLGGAMPAWAGANPPPALGAIPILDLPGPQFLEFYFFVLCAAIGIAVFLRRKGRGPSDAGEPLRDPYLVATLSGGADRAVYAAVAELTRRQLVTTAGPESISRVPGVKEAPAGLHPFERAVFNVIPASIASMREIRAGVTVETGGLRSVLETQHLLQSEAGQRTAVKPINWLMTVVFGLGALKLLLGLTRGKPVGWLIIFLLAAAMVWYFIAKLPQRTIRGDNVLDATRGEHDRDQLRQGTFSPEPSMAGMLPLAIGLYGLPFLTASPMAGLAENMVPEAERRSRGSDSSSGCSTSSSGSADSSSSSSSEDSSSSSDSGSSSSDSGGGGDSGGSSGCGGCGGGGGD